MKHKLNLPVTIDIESIKEITDNFIINLYLLRHEKFPCNCEESKLKMLAIKNIKSSNLYYYSSSCMVGNKNVEYKYQTRDLINKYSLYYLN